MPAVRAVAPAEAAVEVSRAPPLDRLVERLPAGEQVVGVHHLLPSALVALIDGQAGVFDPAAVVAAAPAAAGDARPDDGLQHVGQQIARQHLRGQIDADHDTTPVTVPRVGSRYGCIAAL